MKSHGLEKGGLDLLEYLRIVWRRKWLVLFVTAAVFGIAVWRTYRTEPLYEAKVTVLFNPSAGAAILDRLPTLGASRGIETEIEILKSRVIGERTAVRLQRHYALNPLPAGVSLELTDVTVTEKTLPGVYALTFVGDAGRYQVKDPRGNVIGLGRPGQPFEAGDLSFTLSKVLARSGSSVEIVVPKLAALGNALRSRLKVEIIRGTEIVSLGVKGNDPQEAARTVNAFAETYVDFTRQQKIQQLITMRLFLEKQIDVFRKDLLKTGQALSDFGLDKNGAEGVLGRLRPGAGLYSGIGDLRYELARRLFDLEMKRSAMQFTYTPNHRIFVELDREIADVRNRLAKQLQLERQDMPLQDLLQQSQIKGSMYSYMLQKQQETRLVEASELGSARIIDPAIPPEAPVSPDVSRSMKVSGMLGLSLGIGLALLLGYLDRTVKDVQDLEERVGLPAFGAIPQMLSSVPRRFLGSVTSVKELAEPSKFLVGINGARTRAAEAYRALRTSMEFAIPEAPARAFLFTSAGPGEGKSLTVANLAIAMSQMGRRVLVIDADLRNPTQHKLFELAGQPGLTEVLSKKFSWRDARASTGVENLDVIPCRQVPPNPAELLGGQAMRELLEEAKLEYEVVLLDSPPVLLFTDGCVLAPLVNGVLLVVRASVGTPEAIARAQALLQGVRGKVVGAILNAIPSEGIPHYGFYGYHRYYSTEETEDRKQLTNWGRVKDLARDILSRARRT